MRLYSGEIPAIFLIIDAKNLGVTVDTSSGSYKKSPKSHNKPSIIRQALRDIKISNLKAQLASIVNIVLQNPSAATYLFERDKFYKTEALLDAYVKQGTLSS